jgi:hypothetical protein
VAVVDAGVGVGWTSADCWVGAIGAPNAGDAGVDASAVELGVRVGDSLTVSGPGEGVLPAARVAVTKIGARVAADVSAVGTSDCTVTGAAATGEGANGVGATSAAVTGVGVTGAAVTGVGASPDNAVGSDS